ncbi:3'5'-cyclic nucleotide phosphodiesterase, partial [Kipferlia bialata]
APCQCTCSSCSQWHKAQSTVDQLRGYMHPQARPSPPLSASVGGGAMDTDTEDGDMLPEFASNRPITFSAKNNSGGWDQPGTVSLGPHALSVSHYPTLQQSVGQAGVGGEGPTGRDGKDGLEASVSTLGLSHDSVASPSSSVATPVDNPALSRVGETHPTDPAPKAVSDKGVREGSTLLSQPGSQLLPVHALSLTDVHSRGSLHMESSEGEAESSDVGEGSDDSESSGSVEHIGGYLSLRHSSTEPPSILAACGKSGSGSTSTPSATLSIPSVSALSCGGGEEITHKVEESAPVTVPDRGVPMDQQHCGIVPEAGLRPNWTDRKSLVSSVPMSRPPLPDGMGDSYHVAGGHVLHRHGSKTTDTSEDPDLSDFQPEALAVSGSRAWSVVPGAYQTLKQHPQMRRLRIGLDSLVDGLLEPSKRTTPTLVHHHLREFEERLARDLSTYEASCAQGGEGAGGDAETLEARYISSILSLDFDATEWSRRQGDLCLPYLAYLLHRYFALGEVVSVNRFAAAVMCFNTLYRPSSTYHNCVHAADVLQMVAMMVDRLRQTERGRSLCPERVVAITLLAAAAHDVEHCGVTSDLLVSIRHPLYYVFGPNSTLERYHASLGSFILRYFCVFDALPAADVDQCILMFERLILATDPKSLFKSAALIDSLVDGTGSASSCGKGGLQGTLMGAILRVADIGNAARPFPIAKAHSLNVMREFFRTGDLEVKHGLERGAFRDPTQGTASIRECQVSFIQKVVRRYALSLRDLCYWLCRVDIGSGKGEGEREREADTPTAEGCGGTPVCALGAVLDSMVASMDTNADTWEEVPEDDPDIAKCLQYTHRA